MVTEVTSPPTVWLCIRVVPLVTSTLTAALGLNPSSQLRETLVSEVESMTSPSTISGRPIDSCQGGHMSSCVQRRFEPEVTIT